MIFDCLAYLDEHRRLLDGLDLTELQDMVTTLRQVRDRDGRVFCVGNGGGQAHASHLAADLRKISNIEAYAWGDNVADLTAWVNDANWAASTSSWLAASRYGKDDALFVFSVGGTSDTTSANLRWALSYAKGSTILGITGQPGLMAEKGYATVQIVLGADTPHTEGLQSVLAHLLVTCL